MSRLVRSSGEAFATGECPFESRPLVAGDLTRRIFIPMRFGHVETKAVVDTGGAYLIVEAALAEALGLDETTSLGRARINLRSFTVDGDLHRAQPTIQADAGEALTLEATVFVPDLPPGVSWDLPPYVGWQGCLDRIRVAVDPAEDRFFFGAI